MEHRKPALRIAIEPGQGPLVGQRIDVRDLDTAGLKRCLGQIVLASHAAAEALSTHIVTQTDGLAYEDGVNLIRI